MDHTQAALRRKPESTEARPPIIFTAVVHSQKDNAVREGKSQGPTIPGGDTGQVGR